MIVVDLCVLEWFVLGVGRGWSSLATFQFRFSAHEFRALWTMFGCFFERAHERFLVSVSVCAFICKHTYTYAHLRKRTMHTEANPCFYHLTSNKRITKVYPTLKRISFPKNVKQNKK